MLKEQDKTMSKFTEYLEAVSNNLKKELTKIFDMQCYKIENKIAYFKYIETDYNHIAKKSEKSINFCYINIAEILKKLKRTKKKSYGFRINMLKTENGANAGIELKTAIDVNEQNIKILEQI